MPSALPACSSSRYIAMNRAGSSRSTAPETSAQGSVMASQSHRWVIGGSVGESITQIITTIGPDLVVVTQQTVAIGIRPSPNQAAITAALTAAIDGVRPRH